MVQRPGADEAATVKALVAKHWTAGVGSPHDIVKQVMADPEFPRTPAAVQQLEAAFGDLGRDRSPVTEGHDYDAVVEQSFPASDPPPLP